MKKFELTAETKVQFGKTLYRIKALVDIRRHNVNAGDLGGYVEKEENVSMYGDAWVSGNARVYGNARVSGNAIVYGNARVSGNAIVYGNARVYGNAGVSGNAIVYGNAGVSPVNIIGLRYNVTITDKNIQIGCELHTKEEWASFDRLRISQMDKGAWDWWKEHKNMILSASKLHTNKLNGK